MDKSIGSRNQNQNHPDRGKRQRKAASEFRWRVKPWIAPPGGNRGRADVAASLLIEPLEPGSPFPLRRHHGTGYFKSKMCLCST